jgi:hypothetical protein
LLGMKHIQIIADAFVNVVCFTWNPMVGGTLCACEHFKLL